MQCNNVISLELPCDDRKDAYHKGIRKIIYYDCLKLPDDFDVKKTKRDITEVFVQVKKIIQSTPKNHADIIILLLDKLTWAVRRLIANNFLTEYTLKISLKTKLILDTLGGFIKSIETYKELRGATIVNIATLKRDSGDSNSGMEIIKEIGKDLIDLARSKKLNKTSLHCFLYLGLFSIERGFASQAIQYLTNAIHFYEHLFELKDKDHNERIHIIESFIQRAKGSKSSPIHIIQIFLILNMLYCIALMNLEDKKAALYYLKVFKHMINSLFPDNSNLLKLQYALEQDFESQLTNGNVVSPEQEFKIFVSAQEGDAFFTKKRQKNKEPKYRIKLQESSYMDQGVIGVMNTEALPVTPRSNINKLITTSEIQVTNPRKDFSLKNSLLNSRRTSIVGSGVPKKRYGHYSQPKSRRLVKNLVFSNTQTVGECIPLKLRSASPATRYPSFPDNNDEAFIAEMSSGYREAFKNDYYLTDYLLVGQKKNKLVSRGRLRSEHSIHHQGIEESVKIKNEDTSPTRLAPTLTTLGDVDRRSSLARRISIQENLIFQKIAKRQLANKDAINKIDPSNLVHETKITKELKGILDENPIRMGSSKNRPQTAYMPSFDRGYARKRLKSAQRTAYEGPDIKSLPKKDLLHLLEQQHKNELFASRPESNIVKTNTERKERSKKKEMSAPVKKGVKKSIKKKLLSKTENAAKPSKSKNTIGPVNRAHGDPQKTRVNEGKSIGHNQKLRRKKTIVNSVAVSDRSARIEESSEDTSRLIDRHTKSRNESDMRSRSNYSSSNKKNELKLSVVGDSIKAARILKKSIGKKASKDQKIDFKRMDTIGRKPRRSVVFEKKYTISSQDLESFSVKHRDKSMRSNSGIPSMNEIDIEKEIVKMKTVNESGFKKSSSRFEELKRTKTFSVANGSDESSDKLNVSSPKKEIEKSVFSSRPNIPSKQDRIEQDFDSSHEEDKKISGSIRSVGFNDPRLTKMFADLHIARIKLFKDELRSFMSSLKLWMELRIKFTNLILKREIITNTDDDEINSTIEQFSQIPEESKRILQTLEDKQKRFRLGFGYFGFFISVLKKGEFKDHLCRLQLHEISLDKVIFRLDCTNESFLFEIPAQFKMKLFNELFKLYSQNLKKEVLYKRFLFPWKECRKQMVFEEVQSKFTGDFWIQRTDLKSEFFKYENEFKRNDENSFDLKSQMPQRSNSGSPYTGSFAVLRRRIPVKSPNLRSPNSKGFDLSFSQIANFSIEMGDDLINKIFFDTLDIHVFLNAMMNYLFEGCCIVNALNGKKLLTHKALKDYFPESTQTLAYVIRNENRYLKAEIMKQLKPIQTFPKSLNLLIEEDGEGRSIIERSPTPGTPGIDYSSFARGLERDSYLQFQDEILQYSETNIDITPTKLCSLPEIDLRLCTLIYKRNKNTGMFFFMIDPSTYPSLVSQCRGNYRGNIDPTEFLQVKVMENCVRGVSDLDNLLDVIPKEKLGLFIYRFLRFGRRDLALLNLIKAHIATFVLYDAEKGFYVRQKGDPIEEDKLSFLNRIARCLLRFSNGDDDRHKEYLEQQNLENNLREEKGLLDYYNTYKEIEDDTKVYFKTRYFQKNYEIKITYNELISQTQEDEEYADKIAAYMNNLGIEQKKPPITLQAIIDVYSNEDQERIILTINNKICVEKLINVLQLKEARFRTFALQTVLAIQKPITGRKAVVVKLSNIDSELFRIVNRESLKYNLATLARCRIFDENFVQQTIFLVSSIEDIGKCYCTIKIKSSYNSFSFEKIILLHFDVFPVDSKGRIMTVIMNSHDLLQYYKIRAETLVNKKTALIIPIFQKIVSSFAVVTDGPYKKIFIPIEYAANTESKSLNNLRCYLVNRYDRFRLRDSSGISFPRYLSPIYKENVTILKKIIRSANHYFILTVEKLIFSQKYIISLYSPTSARIFTVSFTKSDMERLTKEFSEKVYPISEEEFDDLITQSGRNFSRFLKYLETYVQAIKTFGNDHAKQLKEFLGRFSQKEKYERKIRNLAARYHMIDRFGHCNFAEIVIWSNILLSFKMEVSKSKKWIINIDNFSGIIQETLYSGLSKVGDILISLTIILLREDAAMNPIDSSEFIRYSETEKYSFYVKVHILGKEIFINEKLSMKKVIELKNTLDKTPTDPKELEQTFFMRQIDLFVYANFIANRILKLTLKRGQGVDVSQSMNQQNFFASMFERNIKVNSSVDIRIRVDPNYRMHNPILIYKRIFSLADLQVISILFLESTKEFIVQIFNSLKSITFEKRYNFQAIQKYIPYAFRMIMYNQFSELGERIFLAQKNNLLIAIQYHSKKVKQLGGRKGNMNTFELD